MAVTGLLLHIRHTRLIRRVVMMTVGVLLFLLVSRYVFLSLQQEERAQQLALQRVDFLVELLAQQLKLSDQPLSSPESATRQQSAQQTVVQSQLQVMIDSYSVGLLNNQVVLFYPSGQPMLANTLQDNHRYLSDVAVWPDPPRSERRFVGQRLYVWQSLPQGYWLYASHTVRTTPIAAWFWWYTLGTPLLFVGIVLLMLVLPLGRIFEHLQQLTSFAQQIDHQSHY